MFYIVQRWVILLTAKEGIMKIRPNRDDNDNVLIISEGAGGWADPRSPISTIPGSAAACERF
jgi:hypothetical protein